MYWKIVGGLTYQRSTTRGRKEFQVYFVFLLEKKNFIPKPCLERFFQFFKMYFFILYANLTPISGASLFSHFKPFSPAFFFFFLQNSKFQLPRMKRENKATSKTHRWNYCLKTFKSLELKRILKKKTWIKFFYQPRMEKVTRSMNNEDYDYSTVYYYLQKSFNAMATNHFMLPYRFVFLVSVQNWGNFCWKWVSIWEKSNDKKLSRIKVKQHNLSSWKIKK